MINKFFQIRRKLLKLIVPEWIWPNFILMDGVEVPIRNMNFSFGVKKILVSGLYEKSERELIINTLNIGDQVIEMGGSIGVITALIRSRIGDEGRVVSIEASSELTMISRSWLNKYANLKIVKGFGFPVLIAPEKYHFSQFITDGNSLGGLVTLDSNLKKGSDIFDLQKIQDDFAILPNALVIDIEGSEVVFTEKDILLPNQINVIIIELHPHIYGFEKMNQIIEAIVKFEFQLNKRIEDVYLFVKKR
jgi:hypothetical protein